MKALARRQPAQAQARAPFTSTARSWAWRFRVRLRTWYELGYVAGLNARLGADPKPPEHVGLWWRGVYVLGFGDGQRGRAEVKKALPHLVPQARR